MGENPDRTSVLAPDLSPAAQPAGGEPKGHEYEIKFRATAEAIGRAMASPLLAGRSADRVARLKTRYFDTPGNDLRANRIVLRIREKGGAAPVLGAKFAAAADPFLRREIEIRSPGTQPDLSPFGPDVRAQLSEIVGKRPLKEKFQTVIERRSRTVAHGGSLIEVAFDQGKIASGKRGMALAEIETELISGHEQDVCDLALRLAAELSLSLDAVSKAEKGFRFLLGETAKAEFGQKFHLFPEATLDTAVRAIIAEPLGHFLANWAALRDGDDAEAVHQLRVALRRLRSGLAIVKRAVPHPALDELRDEAKKLASGFGAARNIDVFAKWVATGPLSGREAPAARKALLAAIETRRKVAYGEARALVDGSAATVFCLKVQSFLARRAWHEGVDEAALQRLEGGAAGFAGEVMEHLWKRAAKRGKDISELSDKSRHQLRIALKNLRYGAEFLAGLFDRPHATRKFSKRIAAMQDLLGAHNDLVMASQFLAEFAPTLPAKERPVVEYVRGWIARGETNADDKLAASWKRLKRTKRFWA